MTKQILCTLCAGLLAGSALTACGTDPATVADTEISDQIMEETAPPETTAEPTETSPAETDTTETAEAAPEEDDLAEARRALERYIESSMTGDVNAMLENSNLELLVLTWGGSLSEELLEEWSADITGSAEPEITYEIGAGREDADMLAEINGSAQKRLESFREYSHGYHEHAHAHGYEDDDVYSAETLARIEYFMQPIDALYVFPVRLTDGDQDAGDEMYVIRLDGVWMVDTVLTDGLFDIFDDDFADDTEPEPEETAKEIVIPEPVTLTDADIEEARNVLAKCLTYQNKCDLNGLRKVSNFEAMMLVSVGISLSGSDMDLLAEILSEAEDYTYKIARGKSVPEQLAQYNAHEKEALESETFAALPEKYKEQDVNMLRHFLKPAQALCAFSVTFTYADGTASEETWYVLMIDGEWVVDYGFVDDRLAAQED